MWCYPNIIYYMIMWCYPNIISYQYAQQMYIINVLPIKFLLHQGYTSKKQKLFQDKRANQLHHQTQGQEFGKSWNRNLHLNVVRHIDKQLNYWQLPIKNKWMFGEGTKNWQARGELFTSFLSSPKWVYPGKPMKNAGYCHNFQQKQGAYPLFAFIISDMILKDVSMSKLLV